MSSRLKRVSYKETMDSYSNKLLLALIAFSSIAFLLVVIGLSFGGKSTFTIPVIVDNNVLHNDESEIITPRSSLDGDDVLVPLECCLPCLDTVPGEIIVCDANIDYPLPLCLDNAELSDWYIDFCVIGGYTPTDGIVTIYQKDLVGCNQLKMTFTEIDCPACCCDMPANCEPKCYKATFTVFCLCPAAVDCAIQLASNHLPDSIDSPCGWEICLCDVDPDKELGKRVCLDFDMDWEGCNGPDQSFAVILAHKNCVPRVPPLKISSPEKK